jgi:hypothetical protein
MPSDAFLMEHLNFGVHTSKTRESTVNYRSFWFLALYVELHFHTLSDIPDLLVIGTRILVH